MAAQGMIPARGRWTTREFTTTSTATYKKGCAVAFSAALGTISELSGGAPGFLGIAMQDSVNSLPSTKVQIAIPNGPECTAMMDVPVTATSLLTVGFNAGLYKVGNYNSFITMSYTSANGRPFTIASPLNSATSQIEVAFQYAALAYGSADSQVQL